MASQRSIRAGRAFVELFADNSKLVSGLRAAKAKIQAFGHAAARIMKTAAVGTAAVGTALAASAKVFGVMGDNIAKMAKRTGVSVEALSGLQFAASRSGVAVGELEGGLRGMARTVLDADRGLSTATDSLDRLGLAAGDLQGLAPEDQFKLLADRISQVPDATTRAALAMKIFGRSGTALLPMMQDGAKGIDDLVAAARKMGLIITTEQARAAEAFQDQWGDMLQTLKMVAFNVGHAVAPVIQKAMQGIVEASAKLSAWIRENEAAIIAWGSIASDILSKVGKAVETVAAAIGRFVISAERQSAIQKDLTDQARKLAGEDRWRAQRLQELAKKQALTNDEMREAKNLIRELESVYGPLSISIDRTTRSLQGMAGALKTVEQAQNRVLVAQLEAQRQALVAEQKKTRNRIVLLERANAIPGLFGRHEERLEQLYKQQTSITKELGQVTALMNQLKHGAAVEEIAPAVKPQPRATATAIPADATEATPTEATPTDPHAGWYARMETRLEDMRLEKQYSGPELELAKLLQARSRAYDESPQELKSTGMIQEAFKLELGQLAGSLQDRLSEAMVSVRGMFNVAGLDRMGYESGGVDEKQLEELQRSRRVLEKIREEGGLTFG